MKIALSLVLSLVGLWSTTTPATAAPILYGMNFTSTFGVAPTSGSFIYDAVSSTFSSFTVEWNAMSFDMTTSANNPTLTGACDSPAPNGADFFSYLNGTGCIASPLWYANKNPSAAGFFLGANAGLTAVVVFADIFGLMQEPYTNNDRGAFTISPVPEPSSQALLLCGGALLAWKCRKRL